MTVPISRRRIVFAALAALALAVLAVVVCPLARLGDRDDFAPGEVHFGRLEIVDSIPLLTLSGSDADIGRAHGELLRGPIRKLLPDYLERVLGSPDARREAARKAMDWEPRLPEGARREMQALADVSGAAYEDVVLANTFLDLAPVGACSTFVVVPVRAAGGGALFGRTLDFPGFGVAERYDLLFHFKRANRHSYVAVGWPGLAGALSGINAHGIAIALNLTPDGARDPSGMPATFIVRQVLEEAEGLDQAIEILSNAHFASSVNLTLADGKGRAVVAEASPLMVRYRYPEAQLLFATNGFVGLGWPNRRVDAAFQRLQSTTPTLPVRISLADVKTVLSGVAQGERTLQAMIFEPAALRLHLSMASLPATDGPYVTLDLAPRLAPGR